VRWRNITSRLQSQSDLRQNGNTDERRGKLVDGGGDISPALSPLPRGKYLPVLYLSWVSRNVRALSRLRSEVSKGRGIFPRRNVHQLRSRASTYRAARPVSLGDHWLVDHEGYDLGGRALLAARACNITYVPRSVDLFGSVV